MDRYTTLITLFLQLTKQPDATCDTVPRACSVAKDIVTVVDGASRLPFDGPAAREASDVLLLAVAFHESGLRESVQNCSYCDQDKSACDGGRSMSMWQLMVGGAWMGHTKDEICGDNRLAAKLALRWLTKFSKGGMPAMFQSYAGCARRSCVASRALQAQFETLSVKVSLAPAPRCGPRFWGPLVRPGSPGVQCPAPAPAGAF